MRTHLERFMHVLTALRAEAVRLSGHDHEPDECKTLLKDAGGLLETFLKEHVYGANAPGGLFLLINGLGEVGVSQVDREKLHFLRTRYNRAKHESAYAAPVDDAITALGDAVDIVASWRGQALGTSEDIAAPSYRRRVWLAGWDHFAHGDGEIQIIAPVDPDDTDFPPLLDLIYLKGLAWPGVLDPLDADVLEAGGLIPQRFLDRWENDGDFAGARVFEGEYRELLRVLAGDELRLDLIDFLKRENNRSAMRSATAFAAIDAARAGLSEGSQEDRVRAVMTIAAGDYGVPATAEVALRCASEHLVLIDAVDERNRRTLTGPRFVSHARLDRERRMAVASAPTALISMNHELLLVT